MSRCLRFLDEVPETAFDPRSTTRGRARVAVVVVACSLLMAPPRKLADWDKMDFSDDSEEEFAAKEREGQTFAGLPADPINPLAAFANLADDDDEGDEEDAEEFEKLRAELARRNAAKETPMDRVAAEQTCEPCAPAKPKKEDKRKVAEDLVERLAKAELLGEEVLTDRARMVELDKQRNANREAIAALRRIGKEHGQEHGQAPPPSLAGEKYWMLQGGSFFTRRPHEDVRSKLEEEQVRLDKEIEALRQAVKKNTSVLCELDPSIAKGSDIHKSFVELHGVSASQLEGIMGKKEDAFLAS